MNKVDQYLLKVAVDLRDTQLTPVAIFLTDLGSPIFLTIVTLLTSFFLWWRGQRGMAVHMIIAGAGAGLLSRSFKLFFARERPSEWPMLVDVSHYSYPSGHALASTAVYLTLAILAYEYLQTPVRRWIGLVAMATLAIGIGLTRIYLGVHFPSDVIAGSMVGLAWAMTCHLIPANNLGR